MLHEISVPQACFSPRERELVLALARAAIPPGRLQDGAGTTAVRKVEDYLARVDATMRNGYKALLAGLDAVAEVQEESRAVRRPTTGGRVIDQG
jgi:hypothetical protein